ncbi:acyltransferase [Luteimonas sp. SX5]|uniref:Acyltransferase n=1 Tax=Luteimonas galliterrae TaxID=2940486 RepID=A0ABT0MIB4_9GAMM|nr:acyltransferase [Luteimonas galliterrae]MCL1634605.1 acyltransferase [Luteimonas galliterrae]
MNTGTSPRLKLFAAGHDNNFNLIRFIAAYSVLISHSFPLSAGMGTYEPFARIGYSLGGIAVDVFFVTSGFLVTASLLRLRDNRAFLSARAWRILPGLAAMAWLTAFLLGPLLTTAAWSEYFTSTKPYQFAVNNVLLLLGLEYRLPGVFIGQPVSGIVNGSLWTLPVEVKCYLGLALLWWISRKSKLPREKFVLRTTLFIVPVSLAMFWIVHAGRLDNFASTLARMRLGWIADWHSFRLAFMFFSGALYWQLRDHIPMTLPLLLVCVGGMMSAAVWPSLFFWIYPLTLAYLVLYVAYVPKGRLLQFNRLGDYSYGIYIYAWPMQQVSIKLVPGIGPWGLMLCATAATLLLAVCSWHFIEQPALARKKRALKRWATIAHEKGENARQGSENNSIAITNASSRPSLAG